MRYFAYGSNMDPKQMNGRGVTFSQRVHAVLRGYSLKFNKVAKNNPREGKANIVSNRNEIVEGVLYDVADLSDLNRYEPGYDRVPVTVKLDDGTEVEVETYIARPVNVRGGLKPTKKYVKRLEKDEKFRKEFIRKLVG